MAIEDSGFGISSIQVIDNSIATVTATTTLNILPSLHPVFSSDGKDNKIVEMKSFNSVLTNYGSDFADINAYGQQNLNVQQVFDAGGSGYICRLMPSDAAYAHAVIKVGVRKATNIPVYKRDGFGEYILDEDGNKVQLTAKQTETVTVSGPEGQDQDQVVERDVPVTVDGLEIKVFVDHATEEELTKYPSVRALTTFFERSGEDRDGYFVVPMAFVRYYARGKCGGNYGIRIINDFLRDAKVNDGRRYQLFLGKKAPSGVEVLSIGNGLSFSFNPNAQISKTIATIESLQKIYQNNDASLQEKQIQIEHYINNYAILTKKIGEIIGGELNLTTGVDPDYEFRFPTNADEVDFFNGYDREGYLFDNVTVNEDSVDLGNYQFLQGGSDGALEGKTGEELEALRTSMLKSFFSGDVDTNNFMNVLKCDAGIIYDANYSMEVKQAIAGILKYRRDICGIFDCGFTENLEEAVAIAKGIRTFAESLDGGENFAICPHCGVTADRVINVRVTGTYEMAYGIHRLYRISPFAIYAGQQNGDAGCVRKTIFDWVIEESKPRGYQEKLAKQNNLYWAVDLGKALSTPANGNYTGRNIYFYSNSSLYTERISKLAEFRNGILVNDLRRVVKLILVKYTFDNDGADAAIKKATAELSSKLSTRYPSNVTINYNLYQSERDKLLNMATCELKVIFPDIFETWTCFIYVERA